MANGVFFSFFHFRLAHKLTGGGGGTRREKDAAELSGPFRRNRNEPNDSTIRPESKRPIVHRTSYDYTKGPQTSETCDSGERGK